MSLDSPFASREFRFCSVMFLPKKKKKKLKATYYVIGKDKLGHEEINFAT